MPDRARSLSSTPAPSTPRDAAHLRIDGVSWSYAERRVLTDVSFAVARGERTGLIGENGSGKSTLLRIAAGLIRPDAGTVTVAAPGGGSARVGLLHQTPPFSPRTTVTAALEEAVAPVRAAARAVDSTAAALAEHPEDPSAARAYDAALAAAERAGAWTVDARIAETLAGLGLAALPREQPTAHLSGGQRSRLALAWLLLSAPDVLLLDEPTNHLDDAAAEHLHRVLSTWRGPVLLASHDRAFLDETAASLVDLDPSPLPHAVTGSLVGDGDGTAIGVTRFSGRYSDYVLARLDARDRWERRYRDEQSELARLRSTVRESHVVGHPGREPRSEARASKKFYSDRNAKVVSRRLDDARSRLEDLAERQIRTPPRDLTFRGLTAGRDPRTWPSRPWSGPLLAASDVGVLGRLRPTSLTVGAGETWLLTGGNGSGKSTLLSVLAGHLLPTTGAVSRLPALRVGLLAQEVHLPDPTGRGEGRTVRQAYEDLVGPDRAAATPLGTFGLVAGRDENQPVGALSVGQQRRLALAVLLADPPDLLLLDEPSNHLSLLLVVQLEAAIPEYPGAVVVASHDRWLRRSWRGNQLELTGP